MELQRVLKEAVGINDEFHFFNLIDTRAKAQGKGRLSEVVISVKDCICVKGLESTAGSAILKGYKPVFDATAVGKVRSEGALIIGKTSQDEFGFGSFNVNVGIGFQVPLNPYDRERACGGSSGGAAGFTAKAPFRHIALAESTGGSIVCPASFCGVIGLCPTYGRVSRYGLMDYANSLDKIGVMAKTMEDIALAMKIISGCDPKDPTSLDAPVPDYAALLKKPITGMKLGIISYGLGKGVDPEVSTAVKNTIKRLEDSGCTLVEIELPLVEKYALPCYYILAMAEASTNLAKYCGMRYGAQENIEGNFNEYFSKVRGNYLGEEAKRRIMLGTFARMAGFRDAYYLKAAKVRAKIIEEYKKAFEKADVLVSPAMPFVAPKFSEIKRLTPMQNYLADILTVGPNLAGLPHISVPVGKNKGGMPIGMMVIGNHLEEGNVMQLASCVVEK
ncbi:Asp-tRNA(Asn)/Glu-tRNA(Gln) amidotransferase subunit GatA [Candidatus Woesearchaeota archaeon]|nr:Asp-tRNA(Asn)/Glu-tRNA(Gln) amidotransferase subunit GatA [Candidatus Woesearchaeota archaeon]